ncbi:hypothetical protein D5O23_23495 [Salmonella enterica subsp. enterica]|nr:hypothetical protein [Salmonella enterica subsp. enterica serovar Mokola]
MLSVPQGVIFKQRVFMCKEFSVRKRLKYSKGVRVFISVLFLATLFFMVLFVYIVKTACL